MEKEYILTLSCEDKPGIVAAVSGFLAKNACNILDSQQAGDPFAELFFMRTHFSVAGADFTQEVIEQQFSDVAKPFAMQWDVTDTTYKPRVLVMVSNDGHCLNHLLYRQTTGYLPVDVVGIVSNHTKLESMAKWHDIPFYHYPVTAETKAEQERKVLALVDEKDVDVVVLARYMQILSPNLCDALTGCAINIHHSFLPGFKGANPYRQAFDRGVKIIGATAHYVTADLDEGPIVEQEVIRVGHGDKPNDLKQMGEDIESQVLSRALRYHIEKRVFLNGARTIVFR